MCVYLYLLRVCKNIRLWTKNVVSVCSESLENVCLCVCALTVLNTGVNTCSGSAVLHRCSYINASPWFWNPGLFRLFQTLSCWLTAWFLLVTLLQAAWPAVWVRMDVCMCGHLTCISGFPVCRCSPNQVLRSSCWDEHLTWRSLWKLRCRNTKSFTSTTRPGSAEWWVIANDAA